MQNWLATMVTTGTLVAAWAVTGCGGAPADDAENVSVSVDAVVIHAITCGEWLDAWTPGRGDFFYRVCTHTSGEHWTEHSYDN